MPPRPRVAGYYRASTSHQADSIPVQQSKVAAYCAQYELDLVAEYEEHISAFRGLVRPALAECVAAAERGEFCLVVVAHSSRAFRDPEEALRTTRILRKAGTGLVSVDEPPDIPDTPGRRLVTLVRLGLDEAESMTKGERLRDKLAWLRENGKWPGGTVSYGLRWDPVGKAFALDPDELPRVRLLFELYVQLAGHASGVARELNLRGVPTRREGAVWHARTVLNIIRNPIYLGYLGNRRGDRDLVALDYPVLQEVVPPELLAAARRIATARRALPRPREKRERPFTGIVFCPRCGRHMVYRPNTPKPGNKTWLYLVCNVAKFEGCPNRASLRADHLEALVVPALAKALRGHAESLPAPAAEDTWAMREALTERRQRLVDAYEEGLIDRGEFSSRVRPLREQIAELELASRAQPLSDTDLQVRAARIESEWGAWNDAEKRLFLVENVEAIVVDPDANEITIRLRRA